MKIKRLSKTCINCKIEKPATLDHFYYRNKTRGWFSSWCIDCRKTNRKKTAQRELETQRIRRRSVGPSAEVKQGLKSSRELTRQLKTLCNKCQINARPFKCRYCKPCKSWLHREKKRIDKCIYKSRLRKAKPKWANIDAIRDFYENKPKGFHVDHIIPIRGETVSGFHVEYNLQYLPALENIHKSNRFHTLPDGNHFSLEHNGIK